MAYVDVPLGPQRIKDSQPLIRQNFIEINTLVDVDHYTFGSPTAGEHKKVTLPDQGISPVFPGNDLGLFAKIPTANPLTTFNELFIRRQDGSETPFSAANLNALGWTYLPSGILLKWGAANANGVSVVAYPVAGNIPVFNTVFRTFTQTIAPAAIDTNETVIVDQGASYLTTSFTVFAGQRTAVGVATPSAFAWITIGT